MTHSFPIRRSSDLVTVSRHFVGLSVRDAGGDAHQPAVGSGGRQEIDLGVCAGAADLQLQMGLGSAGGPGPHPRSLRPLRPAPGMALAGRVRGDGGRSEEHTSELQSLMRISYAVFCLKKQKKPNQSTAFDTISNYNYT